MTEAFIKAAEDKGHTVTRFDAAMKQVGGCHACETCFKTGKACSFDDDFNMIAPAILEADAVVFSTPVYWYSIPAQIKGVIDKMYSFCVAGKEIAGKECAVITCCEENELSVMDGVLDPDRAYGCSAEVEYDRRSAGPGCFKRRRDRKNRRMQTGG